MRILHVIPTLHAASGGPAEGLRQLCQIYRSGGHDVEIVCFDKRGSSEHSDFMADIHRLGPSWGVYGYCGEAARWFEKHLGRYDVVFLNGIWQYGALAAYRALRKRKLPYSVFAHGMLDPYFKERFPLKHLKKSIYWQLFLRNILRGATKVLFTCEEEKKLARGSFSGYDVEEEIVPLGTAGPPCSTSVASREFLDRWPALRGRRIALFLGRIHAKKGVDLLIDAYQATLAQDPAWRLVIAGPDEMGIRRELEMRIQSLGIADRVIWAGMLNGPMKWGAFAASEVFVLPSHQENLGVGITEALACSLPVILSDKVNVWREIAESGAGFVSADTAEGTAHSLRLWSALDACQIDAMRRRARICFERHFDSAVNAHAVLRNVDEIVRLGRRKLRS